MKKENRMTAGKTFVADGRREEKTIYGLEEGEEKYYNLLGAGVGINLNHCFSMGSSHQENFWERVFAYKVVEKDETTKALEEGTGEKYISAQFFELG